MGAEEEDASAVWGSEGGGGRGSEVEGRGKGSVAGTGCTSTGCWPTRSEPAASEAATSDTGAGRAVTARERAEGEAAGEAAAATAGDVWTSGAGESEGEGAVAGEGDWEPPNTLAALPGSAGLLPMLPADAKIVEGSLPVRSASARDRVEGEGLRVPEPVPVGEANGRFAWYPERYPCLPSVIARAIDWLPSPILRMPGRAAGEGWAPALTSAPGPVDIARARARPLSRALCQWQADKPRAAGVSSTEPHVGCPLVSGQFPSGRVRVADLG